jgi:hypothetical protein
MATKQPGSQNLSDHQSRSQGPVGDLGILGPRPGGDRGHRLVVYALNP